MNESIKPNNEDVFRKENIEENTWKIIFKESHVIAKVTITENGHDFIIVENKCKKLYDLKKIRGYILSKIDGKLSEVVN